MHAIAGGTISKIQGEKFGHGFTTSGIGKLLNASSMIDGGEWYNVMSRISLSMLVGGTISSVSGGKFKNGALTAAFQQLNYEWEFKDEYERTKLTKGNRVLYLLLQKVSLEDMRTAEKIIWQSGEEDFNKLREIFPDLKWNFSDKFQSFKIVRSRIDDMMKTDKIDIASKELIDGIDHLMLVKKALQKMTIEPVVKKVLEDKLKSFIPDSNYDSYDILQFYQRQYEASRK